MPGGRNRHVGRMGAFSPILPCRETRKRTDMRYKVSRGFRAWRGKTAGWAALTCTFVGIQGNDGGRTALL